MITTLQTVSSSKVELLVRLMAEHISFIEYLFKCNGFLGNEYSRLSEKVLVVMHTMSL